MSNVVQFQFSGSLSVRSLLIDGAPWFVAGDVCKVLEISNAASSLALLDSDEKCEHPHHGGSGRKPILINESGLYSLILRSRKPQAKAFKKWVTSEVLPALRSTGTYSVKLATRRGSLAPEFYPPWPLSDSDLEPLTRAQIDELTRAISAVSNQFRYKHKAAWALRRKIEAQFGAIVPDLEAWQFGTVRQYIEVAFEKAKALQEQIDSFETLFWDQYVYSARVDLQPRYGQVFAQLVR